MAGTVWATLMDRYGVVGKRGQVSRAHELVSMIRIHPQAQGLFHHRDVLDTK